MRYLASLTLVLTLLGLDAFAQGIVVRRIVIDRPTPPRPPRMRPMTLTEHRIDVRIEDQAAVTEVTQVFFNPNTFPTEGIYLFPLPLNASVSRFTMSMGGKQVTGELLDAKKAAEIYRSIVHQRRDPGLLEYAGRRLLKARLFPLPPRGYTKVTLRFEQVLEPVGGIVEMVYPFRTQAFGDAQVKTSARIDVRSSAGVATLYSPTHKIDAVRKAADHMVASFEEGAQRPERDLRVLYGLGKKPFGLSLASHKPAGADGTFLMLLSPNVVVEDARVLPKDIVFVIDTSGSMGDRGGKKLRQAKAALQYALGRLAPEDTFNVVSFATEARMFRDKPVAADKENVEAALAYVKALEATGGTAIHDALLRSLALERVEGRVPLVFFLTDGEPTVGPVDPKQIRGAANKANTAKARLFVFGVGDDVNAKLLGDLAADHRGSGHFVAESENIELKVSALYDKVASPVLTDVTVSVEGVGAYDVFPRRLGDLFKGQQVAIVGRYKNAGPRAVTLKGKLGSKEIRFVYEGTFAADGQRDYLPRLWAVRKVAFLLDEIQRNGEKAELVTEVKRLGTRFGIVTPYTSFLVVEEGEMLRRRANELSRRADRGGEGGGGAPAPGAPSAETIAGLRKKAKEIGDVAGDMDESRDALAAGRGAGKGAVGAARHAEKLREGDARRYGVKTVGAKSFRFKSGVWTDLDPVAKDTPKKRVKYMSDEWFALLEDATLARYLSVGKDVRVLHEGTLYEIHE